MIIVHNDQTNHLHYHCEYNPDTKILNITWEGIVDEERAKKMFEAILDFTDINQTIAQYVIMNNMKGTFTKMNKYISEKVIPRFEKSGTKFSATVFGKDPFTRFALNQVIKIATANSSIETKLFGDEISAKKWLSQKMNISL